MKKYVSQQSVFLFLFFILLFSLPLPLGSNRSWAWSLGQLYVFGLLLLYSACNWQHTKNTIRTHYLAIGIFMFVIAWLTLQYINIPIDWLKFFSIHSANAYQLLGLESGSVSIDREATLSALLKLSSYCCVFILALCLITTPKQVQSLLLFLVLVGTFNAFYGAFDILSRQESSLVFGMQNNDNATGTFVYKNHFANFLLLCLSAGVGYFISTLSRRQYASKTAYWRAWFYTLLETKTVVRLGITMMVIALVMSHSRMGNTAFLASLLAVSLLYLVKGKHVPKGFKVLIISMLIIDTFVVSTWFGLDKVKSRLEATSLEAESRDEVVLDALPIIQDYRYFGSGGGSFETIFENYKSEQITGFYDQAHNDYLQFSIEYGVPVTLLLGGLLFYMVFWSIKILITSHDKRMAGGSAATLMALVGMLIHMSVDFPLLPPANASYFVLFLALTCSLKTSFKNKT